MEAQNEQPTTTVQYDEDDEDSMDAKAVYFIGRLATEGKLKGMPDTWYCIAACAFAACNQAKYVAEVYEQAIFARPNDIPYQHNVLKRIKGAPPSHGAGLDKDCPLIVQNPSSRRA